VRSDGIFRPPAGSGDIYTGMGMNMATDLYLERAYHVTNNDGGDITDLKVSIGHHARRVRGEYRFGQREH
jgi:hypothetical protein